MNRQTFIEGLRALGFKVEERKDNFVVFPYLIPVGKFARKEIVLGLQVNGDAPLNPPGGPHVSPRLLPQRPNQEPHPHGGIHESPLGPEWQYWSRPFNAWKDGERSARRYMAHILALFDTQ
jgi:hypothetical protein